MPTSWEKILEQVSLHKTEFKKSYKCLNKNITISKETVQKHKTLLIENYNSIRLLIYNHFQYLTSEHKLLAKELFSNLRDSLIKIFSKHKIHIKIPATIDIPVTENITLSSSDSEESEIDNNSLPESIEDLQEEHKMTNTIAEFLSLASKLIPEFDGRAENLQSFIDALELTELVKGTHEAVAVNLIKTKLKGSIRNLIVDETSIQQIIQKLKTSIKTESVEVLTAKIMNIKQGGKTANVFTQEIENLTKCLENAYITDGLSVSTATKYSTQVAVKAITKNCNNDRVKLIMESGNFSTMNDAISKFVNSCTEATSHPNSIMYIGQNRIKRNANWNSTNNHNRGYNRSYNCYNHNDRCHFRGRSANNQTNRFVSNRPGRGRRGTYRGGYNQNTNTIRLTTVENENSEN